MSSHISAGTPVRPHGQKARRGSSPKPAIPCPSQGGGRKPGVPRPRLTALILLRAPELRPGFCPPPSPPPEAGRVMPSPFGDHHTQSFSPNLALGLCSGGPCPHGAKKKPGRFSHCFSAASDLLNLKNFLVKESGPLQTGLKPAANRLAFPFYIPPALGARAAAASPVPCEVPGLKKKKKRNNKKKREAKQAAAATPSCLAALPGGLSFPHGSPRPQPAPAESPRLSGSLPG